MSHHIIVNDDAPSILGLYEELLTDEGFDLVATFSQPPDQPRKIETYQPDLIIMDWLFGAGVTGMQALRLKTYPSTAAIPIIVSTGAGRSVLEEENILTYRGVRVLHKSFALDGLLAMVEQLLAPKHILV